MRAVLQYLNIENGVEVQHSGDLPARSGLGSSSSFTVSMLNAANALLQGTLKDQLAGVFAVTNGSQVASGSGLSPFSIVGQVVPGSEQVVNPLPAETPSLLTPPAWLVPFMIATGVIILLVIVFVLIRAMEKNRIRRLTGRQSAADEEEGEDEEQDQDQDKKS